MSNVAGYIDGHPACACQMEWIPRFRAACAWRGLPIPSIYQLIGAAAASATIHEGGGASDFHPLTPEQRLLSREMGNWSFHRTLEEGFDPEHDHGLLRGCPHLNAAALEQLREFDVLHEDGLLDHAPDPGPFPPRRTWQQGIAWDNQQKEAAMTAVTFVDSALGFGANTWTVAQCDAFIAAVKKAGHAGVFVYLSRSSSKCMPRWAILRVLAAGLAVTFVWEDGTDNPTKGETQGHADAAEAIRQLHVVGAPAGVTVFVAYDRNNYTVAGGTPDLAYGQAFTDDLKAAGYVPGGYGDYAVAHAPMFAARWKVETWGADNSGVHVVQCVTNTLAQLRAVPGCDVNLVVHGFRCWTATPVAPAVKPIPALPQTVVHAHNALANLAMVPATESATRLSHIHAAQAHIKESIA